MGSHPFFSAFGFVVSWKCSLFFPHSFYTSGMHRMNPFLMHRTSQSQSACVCICACVWACMRDIDSLPFCGAMGAKYPVSPTEWASISYFMPNVSGS